MALWTLPLARVDEQSTITELFGVAFGPFIVGIALFFFGVMGQRAGAFKPGIKWLGLVPLVIGVVIGWDYFQKVSGPEGDAFVMLNMIEKKKLLYQLAFILPIVGLILLPVMNHFMLRRPGLAESEVVDHEEMVDAGFEEEYDEEYEDPTQGDEFDEGEVYEEEIYEEDIYEEEVHPDEMDAEEDLLEEAPPETDERKADPA